MPLLDDSIDVFGALVVIGSATTVAWLTKPEWATYVFGLSVLAFVVVSNVLPGRKLKKAS